MKSGTGYKLKTLLHAAAGRPMLVCADFSFYQSLAG